MSSSAHSVIIFPMKKSAKKPIMSACISLSITYRVLTPQRLDAKWMRLSRSSLSAIIETNLGWLRRMRALVNGKMFVKQLLGGVPVQHHAGIFL